MCVNKPLGIIIVVNTCVNKPLGIIIVINTSSVRRLTEVYRPLSDVWRMSALWIARALSLSLAVSLFLFFYVCAMMWGPSAVLLIYWVCVKCQHVFVLFIMIDLFEFRMLYLLFWFCWCIERYPRSVAIISNPKVEYFSQSRVGRCISWFADRRN